MLDQTAERVKGFFMANRPKMPSQPTPGFPWTHLEQTMRIPQRLIGRQSLSTLGAAVGAFMMFGPPAHAAVIGATASNSVFASDGSSYFGHYEDQSNFDLTTSLTATFAGSAATLAVDSNTQSLTATASSGTGTPSLYGLSADAVSHLNYHVGFSGATVDVPLLMSYTIRTATTGEGFADASIELCVPFPGCTPSGELSELSPTVPYTSLVPPSSFEESGIFHLDSNVDTLVSFYVNAGTTTIPDQTSSALAIVDPRIYIDPAFLAANPGFLAANPDARIEVSAGIGNVDQPTALAVPEPETWALMLGGLALLAGVRRSRTMTRLPETK